jgi:phosphotransferase system  glucose/maltose/N-acetylglucosamine-specific IIC component
MPIYYFTVDFFIKKMDIATPGRNGNMAGVSVGNDDDDDPSPGDTKSKVAAK